MRFISKVATGAFCVGIAASGVARADERANNNDLNDKANKGEKDDKGSKAEKAEKGDRFSFAVIGDIPYGDAQIVNFPKVIANINADPEVRLVNHIGDIKSGSSLCSDTYFASIRSSFDQFADPLLYTPGDNEWTDCHRANNGSYNPLERLATIRRMFFPTPGKTLGMKPMSVKSQAAAGFPENVRFDKADVAFAAVHIVGSNNGLVNWTGKTAPTVEQLAEVQSRTASDIALINETFDHATEEHSRAVVLMVQADMFDPTLPCPSAPATPCPPVFSQWNGFQTLVQTIAARAAAFKKPVYLFDGDSHVFNVDKPFAAGAAWPAKYGAGSWNSFYGVTTPADNLTRITIDGSTGVNNWLKVTIDEANPQVLSYVQVPFNLA
jgi:hypothetical protein